MEEEAFSRGGDYETGKGEGKGKHQDRCVVPMGERNILLSMTFAEALKQVGGIRQWQNSVEKYIHPGWWQTQLDDNYLLQCSGVLKVKNLGDDMDLNSQYTLDLRDLE